MIYIIGDSHTTALKKALDARKDESEAYQSVAAQGLETSRYFSKACFEDAQDSLRFISAAATQRLQALTGQPVISKTGDDVFLVVLGFHTYRICHHQMWRKFSPLKSEVSSGKQFISEAVLQKMIHADCEQVLALYHALKLANAPCVAVEAPALSTELSVLKYEGTMATIKYVNERYRSYVAERLADMQVPCIRIDEQTVDGDGFLLKQYDKGDRRHANASFGEAMLQKTEEVLGSLNDALAFKQNVQQAAKQLAMG